MKTERKFFDTSGKEVAPKDAVKCVELTFDANDRLVKSTTYVVVNK